MYPSSRGADGRGEGQTADLNVTCLARIRHLDCRRVVPGADSPYASPGCVTARANCEMSANLAMRLSKLQGIRRNVNDQPAVNVEEHLPSLPYSPLVIVTRIEKDLHAALGRDISGEIALRLCDKEPYQGSDQT